MVEDVKAVIGCGRPAVVCAVTDLRRLFIEAVAEVKGSRKAAGQSRQLQPGVLNIPEHPQSESSAAIMGDGHRHGAASSAAAEPRQRLGIGQTAEGSSTLQQGILRSEGGSARNGRSVREKGDRRLKQQLKTAERRLAYYQSWANEQPRDVYQHILEAVAEALQAFEQSQDTPDAHRERIVDMALGQVPDPSRLAQLGSTHGQSVLRRPVLEELGSSGDEEPVTASHGGFESEHIVHAHKMPDIDYDSVD